MEHEIQATDCVCQQHGPNEKNAERAWFGVFAILLGLLTARHELFIDESQAWLIARDSKNFLEMLGHLRYEGHPALWYSILYVPAHLLWSPLFMQAVNYVLALLMASLVLTERRLALTVRVLCIFSVFIFFHMGVMARSYMLAGLLLMGAVRLLTAERPRHWTGMFLLALAVNTHFFAIPVVCAVFVWICRSDRSPSLRAFKELFRCKQFWGSAALLSFALFACYFTVRPAHDLYTPHYERTDVSRFGYFILGLGRVWDYFVPFPLGALIPEKRELLGPWHQPSVLAASITLCLWFLAIGVLRSVRSRLFFITASVLWMAEVSVSVHIPGPFHCSFLFLAFVIALAVDAIDYEEAHPF